MDFLATLIEKLGDDENINISIQLSTNIKNVMELIKEYIQVTGAPETLDQSILLEKMEELFETSKIKDKN